MSTFKHPAKILFQLSGSIACFKACSLLSALVKAGHEVELVATANALKFVGEATLEGLTGRRVHTSPFESGRFMTHIHLIRWADVIVLCPASANMLNKFAAGLGDDLVSTLFLAHDFEKPYIVAPAMNQTMYAHPATRASLQTLKDWGVTILETESGALACGENGEGRMLEPDVIFRAIESALRPDLGVIEPTPSSKQKKILITSGGTVEPIDGVRSITNTSTGQTGAELAEWFVEEGYFVTLLHAQAAALPQAHKNLKLRDFRTFSSLQTALTDELSSVEYDMVIHLAAVSDYSLDEIDTNGTTMKAPLKSKIDAGDTLTLKLKKNPKLIDSLRESSKNPDVKVVAFKLTTTQNLQERLHAIETLASHAEPDIIVHNDLGEIANGLHPFAIYAGLDPRNPVTKLDGARALAKVLSTFLDPQANSRDSSAGAFL